MFFIFFIFFSFVNSKYKEIELKLKNRETEYDFSKWIPSLFSSTALIGSTISIMGHYKTIFKNIYIYNPYTLKYLNQSLYSDIFLYTSIFNEIYIAKTYNNIFPTFPKYCLFGLDYS